MRIVVASGYFTIMHVGHVRYLQAARKLGDKLVVIVNNDVQQKLKKGFVLVKEHERVEVVQALERVDEAILSVDNELPVSETLDQLAILYVGDEIIFANGGDRTNEDDVPEIDVCRRNHISMQFNVGGEKATSTTDIMQRVVDKA